MTRARWLVLGMLLPACIDPTGPETPIEGHQLYNQYCARCHAADGSGTAEQPATKGKLNNLAIMRGLNDERLKGSIRMGKPPSMPAFGSEFSDAKLMVLAAYVRTLSDPAQREQSTP